MSMGARNMGSRIRPERAIEPEADGQGDDSVLSPAIEAAQIAGDDRNAHRDIADAAAYEPIEPLAAPEEAAFTAPEATSRSVWRETVPTIVLGALGIAWVAAVAVALSGETGPIGLLRITTWIGVGAAPLALLGILWLVIATGGRGESRRYGRVSRAMRVDSENLVGVLGIVTRRLEESRALIAAQSAQLEQLGAGAAGRFAAASETMRRDSSEFQRLVTMLEGTGAGARDDIKALMSDLPAADDHARRIAQTLRTAGITAQDQVEALEKQLSAIAEAAHMADMQVNSSADRLTAQLGHLASNGTQTVRRIEEVALGLDRTIAHSLETAGSAIDVTRHGIAEQAAALTALAEQARAALERAGTDQTAALSRRLDEITGRLDAFVHRLAGQDAASLSLVSNLEAAIDRIEERFSTLGTSGAEQTADLAESLVALAAHSDHVARALGGGTVAAGTLLDRVSTVRRVLDSNARDLEDTIPASLSRLRLHAERSLASVSAAAPQAETLASLAETTAGRLAEVASSVEAQGRAIDALGSGVDERLGAVREQAHALNRLIAETSQSAESLAAGTTSRLMDAMIRVRETASHAAEQARVALTNIVPDVADQFGSAVESTVDRVLAEKTRAHIEGVAYAADAAIAAADRAGQQLRTQIDAIERAGGAMEDRLSNAGQSSAEQLAARVAAIAQATEAMERRLSEASESMETRLTEASEATAEQLTSRIAAVTQAAEAMEARVSDARESADKQDDQAFSRQVALLVESLNSAAIDVAKILSNDITDTAWAAYLRGDRGVFTRRAVRLLDSGETREILRVYTAEPEFREQVNRYIHDFEAMLRRVLSSRDGGPLGVTMLSSDMGKLYVALAQAIERLRV
ncbi:hypothetical protein PQ455_09030 [Sphingomonas naphthae]|uniref:ATPase n=1 Tax=Sphingomonas naphthae TaxID=1813468 RepID=A0ABY7TRQ9_9SPHN|nr:hypothetical protein [Sphingomonas naphthae]WCT75342.1 hypothetical protein PQ455_09030 [Sphingomonas naphthae]